jgi:spoIIIJ-associated protein
LGLVEAFGVDADVTTEVRDGAVHVDIEGDNLGLLVGPKGATLTALEEIVRAVVQRSTGGHSARVHVDVGGYRQRRREALAEFARRLAAEVQNEGAERALEPMSPPDRKVVHDTIAEMDGVTTASVGEEPRRRVVIRPA